MTEGSDAMPARVEIELDIFSGMPNPAWSLTNAEADTFAKKLAGLAQTSARELSGNLGYRGFIVRVTQGAATQWLRIQRGTVHIAKSGTTAHALDEGRELERWLLDTGRPHVKNEIFQIAERDLQ